jgi:hypothetical protein
VSLSNARREEERSEAQAYADAIRFRMDTTDWFGWNRDIIARWSKSALLRIKVAAWKIVEERT